MRKILFCSLVFLLSSILGMGCAHAVKILHLSSYNQDLPWTAGINTGIRQVLENHPGIELKSFYMDTKHHPSEPEKKAIARKAKQFIEQWKPDLVISSDDNAAKYVIVPYFKNSKVPFVFCGINWSAKEYGFPCSNVTGMIEVQLIDQIINHLKVFAKGHRIGLLKGDDFSARKEAEYFEKSFHIQLEKHFVTNFKEWKQEYLQLQSNVDMLLLGNAASIADWNPNLAQVFINKHTRIPSGNWDPEMAPYALITVATIAEEQGKWSARTALEILGGRSPASIPLVKNKEAHIILNLMLAQKLGIHFPIELMESASFISAKKPKVFYVNSYHKGYLWSDKIEKGLLLAFQIKQNGDETLDFSQSKVQLKILRLDTKLNRSENFKKQAALEAKKVIDEWKPNILVVSDDNAVKYLVVPYFKNTDMPVIFCGVNADISEYGLPADNITGMIEVNPIKETIALLRKLSRGNRIGYIGADVLSDKKVLDKARKILEFSDGRLVMTFAEWKNDYLRLQNDVDMLLWLSPVGIEDWHDRAAKEFIRHNTRIPTGAINPAALPYSLLGCVKIPEEFGWWAGKTALRILDGEPLTNIPMTTNKRSKVYLNMDLARRMGVLFPMGMIKDATFLEQ